MPGDRCICEDEEESAPVGARNAFRLAAMQCLLANTQAKRKAVATCMATHGDEISGDRGENKRLRFRMRLVLATFDEPFVKQRI